jgi:hypothetical protein
MLNAATIQRDARACMMDWPVQIRHYYDPSNPESYHAAVAAFSRADEMSILEAGGLLDQSTINVYYITPDLDPRPQNRDLVAVQMSDGSWKMYEVKHTPDNDDPLSQMTALGLGTPNE